MPEVTRVLVALRWSDVDVFGHVNNVQYLRLLEDARTIALTRWFPDGLALLSRGMLVASHEIEYLVQLDYRIEPVAVDIWVTKLGGAGYHVGYVVQDPPEVGSTRYAVAETSLALFDFDTGAPRRMSSDEREVLGRLLAPPPAFRRRRR